jgi:hypothetical protein
MTMYEPSGDERGAAAKPKRNRRDGSSRHHQDQPDRDCRRGGDSRGMPFEGWQMRFGQTLLVIRSQRGGGLSPIRIAASITAMIASETPS